MKRRTQKEIDFAQEEDGLLSRLRSSIEPAEERLAVESILEREFSWLRRVCLLLAGDEEFGMECLQDVLLQVAKSLPNFREDSQLRTWMFVICRRVVKKKKFRRWVMERRFLLGEEKDVAEEEVNPCSEISAEQRLSEKEVSQRLWKQVEALPEMQRLSVALYYGEEMAIAEISLALGCSESSVKTHLSRARERLKEKFLNE